MFYFTKTPFWLKKLYPNCIWNFSRDEKKIFLSFDDGPHAIATPFVLDQLKFYRAHASFFCLGKNVIAEAEIYKRILNEGHRVGNHTFNHLNGWKTSNKEYFTDIEKTGLEVDSDLFRPPYGRISAFQIRSLKEKLNYKVIMWDVLAGDFDPTVNGEISARRVIKNSRPGSIIVFHDSAKAFPVLKTALPLVLKYFSDKGYSFEAIR